MKYKFFLIVTVLLMVSCSKLNSYSKFQEKVEKFSEDSEISQEEYSELTELLKSIDEPWVRDLKDSNGEIKSDALVQQILILVDKQHHVINKDNIWVPKKNIETLKTNVYLENSASMDGYVNGETNFEVVIFNLLTGLYNSSLNKNTTINYINSETIPVSTVNSINDIRDFADQLEPDSFRDHGGDRSSSDIANIINQVLTTIEDDKSEDNVAILISDFIFSNKNPKSNDYLDRQGAYIKGIFREKLNKNSELTVYVMQLESKFKGSYYDKADRPIELNDVERPYYIWILGRKNQVLSIKSFLARENLPGLKNSVLFIPYNKSQKTEFSLLTDTSQGKTPSASFDIDDVIKNNKISKAKKINDSFIFEVAVNYDTHELGKSLEYFDNLANYELNSDQFKINSIRRPDGRNKNLTNASHILTIEYIGEKNILPKTILNISVKNKLPKWIDESSILDDSLINQDVNKGKTYGLKIMLDSVFKAFYPTNSTISEFNIPINN